MKIINELLLLKFIQEHKISTSFQQFIKKNNHSAISNIDIFDQTQLQDLALKINTREAKKDPEELSLQNQVLLPWKKGEFKLFLWLVAFYSYHFKVEIPSFKDKDYQLIQSIFCRQSIRRLKYEILCLFPPKETFKSVWEESEISLYDHIIKHYLQTNKKMEWKAISYDLFIASQGNFFKTNAQCRQRWLNHLNPQVSKKTWSRQQDYQLLVSIQKYGLKWAEVSKSFNGSRTEHMVKNRYLSLINKWKKNKARKSNKQIELKMIRTIKRNIERSASNYSQESQHNIIPEGQKSHTAYTNQHNSQEKAQALKQVPQGQKIIEHILQEPPKPFLFQNVQETECQHSISISKVPEYRLIELGPNRYKDESLKETIADIMLKLGFSHPEQIDMFFECHDNWMIEAEQF